MVKPTKAVALGIDIHEDLNDSGNGKSHRSALFLPAQELQNAARRAGIDLSANGPSAV